MHGGDHVLDRVGVSIHLHGVALASHLQLAMEGAVKEDDGGVDEDVVDSVIDVTCPVEN
jgi:hypothetical protein